MKSKPADKKALEAVEPSPEAPDGPGAAGLALRILLVILVIAALAVGASVLLVLIGKVGGLLRILAAMAMAVLIAWFGIGYFSQLGHPPPPDPEPVAVDPKLRLAYLCEMCGLELAVVIAAKDKAPKHCGEEMVLIRK